MRRGARSVALVAANELQRLARDRLALVVTFVAPTVLALVITTALGGGARFHATIGVVDEDGGVLASVLVHDVLGSREVSEVASVRGVESRESAHEQIASGEIDAVVVVPKAFSERALGGGRAELTVLRPDGSSPEADLVESIVADFKARLEAGRLGAQLAGRAAEPDAVIAAAAAVPPLDVSTQQRRAVDLATFMVPAIIVMMLFFGCGQIAEAMVRDRENGTLARIVSGPVRLGSVLAGRAVATVAVAIGAVAITGGVARVVYADIRWGDPIGVAALGLAACLAVGGCTLLVGVLARTPAQAQGGIATLALGFALLSGTLLPPERVPDVFRQLGSATPNGWVFRGISALSTTGSSAIDAMPAVLALLVFAAVTTTAAVTVANRFRAVVA